MPISFECAIGVQVTSLGSTVSFHPFLLDLLCSGARRKGSTNVEKLEEALPSYSGLSSIGRLTG